MSTPNDIEIILHFYCSRAAHPRASAPAVQETIQRLLADGMIRDLGHEAYETTERGQAWVEMICTTPYPEQVWRNPVTKRTEQGTVATIKGDPNMPEATRKALAAMIDAAVTAANAGKLKATENDGTELLAPDQKL